MTEEEDHIAIEKPASKVGLRKCLRHHYQNTLNSTFDWPNRLQVIATAIRILTSGLPERNANIKKTASERCHEFRREDYEILF